MCSPLFLGLKMPELLAKSPKHGVLTLHKHLCDTEEMARRIFQPGLFFTNWCKFFGITEPERWLINLRIACLLHDIGKANEDFQTAVATPGVFKQRMRHEHLSALFIGKPSVWNWLSESPELDVPAITSAVLGHHLKASVKEDSKWGVWGLLSAEMKPLRLHWDDPQVAKTAARIEEVLGRPGMPYARPAKITFEGDNTLARSWTKIRSELGTKGNRFRGDCDNDRSRKLFHVALKAGLIICDSAASAMVREGTPFEWVEEVLHKEALTPEYLNEVLLTPRINEIRNDRGVFEWNDIQRCADTLGPRALIRTSCGSGKTLAALVWAKAQARTHKFSRVIYLYPTRGTATEGYKDYLGRAPNSLLLTGTAQYELERIRENPSEERLNPNEIPEVNARLFALGYWPIEIFSATVDQFLSFVSGSYSAICGLPLLTNSVVIFDEIHSYDVRMWRALKNFIAHFDIPVLCLTATLQETREAFLKEQSFEIVPNDANQSLSDLKISDERPRYNIRVVSYAEALMEAQRCHEKRLLWVVNQVRKSQETYQLMKLSLPHAALYHSRFKLEDRHVVHRNVIDSFRTPIAAAVTTQVAEMSLDLCADVLITEMALIPSLIQRMGRAARKRAIVAEVLVYEPESLKPYFKDEMEAARGFIASVAGSGISQSDLNAAMLEHEKHQKTDDWDSRFLSDAFKAEPETFRLDGYTQPCILDSDLARFEDLRKQKRPIDGLILNLPSNQIDTFGVAAPKWLPRYLSVVEHEHYSCDVGYMPPEKV